MSAAALRKQEMDIASLLMVNRLFTQSCRMQIYAMKDMLLSREKVVQFDRTLDGRTAGVETSAAPA